MFSKEDYRAYFQEVLAMERAMIHNLQTLLQLTRDAKVEPLLRQILSDETRHHSYVKAVLAFLEEIAGEKSKNFSFLRNFVDSLLAEGQIEKRRNPRELFLGTVALVDTETGEEIPAKCMNVSREGLGLETERALVKNRIYDLRMNLYDVAGEIRARGSAVWLNEITPNTFVAGLQFDAPTDIRSWPRRTPVT